jgi:3-deoxy-manno-octulosonate cytidylyltransferase (CMP-KDO synthetase)
MKIVAFIPARYHSTRFFGESKPLEPIVDQKPMIQLVYELALGCSDLSDVFVATDDKRIFDRVKAFGGKAVITKKDHPSGSDRIAEAALKMNLKKDDLVINIQGDQPAYRPESISVMIAPLLEDREIPMSTLRFPITGEKEVRDPFNIKVVTDEDGFALYFSHSPIPCYRDGDPGQIHYKHLGFYAYRMDFLQTFASLPVGVLESAEKLEQLRALENGFKIKVVESPYDSPEVDTIQDIKRVRALLSQSETEA